MRIASAIPILTLGLVSCAGEGLTREAEVQDAVPIYRSLIGRFAKLPTPVIAAFDREATTPTELDTALADYDSPLRELSKATSAGRCVWSYDIPPTISGEYPIDYAIAAGKLLVVRSRRRFEMGDTRASLEDLLVLARFGSDLLQDRWTVGKLLGLVVGSWAEFEIRDLLAQGRLVRSEVELVVRQISPLPGRFPPFERLLRDEQRMALPLLEEIRDLGLDEVVRRVAKDTSAPKELDPIVLQWQAWIRETLEKDFDGAKRRISARWEEQVARLEEAQRMPLNSGELEQRVAGLKAGAKAIVERSARRVLGALPKDDGGLIDIADLIFTLWLPALEKARRKQADCLLLLETTLLACRLELRRLETGHYPADFDNELGEVPRDPFVGGKIRYQRFLRPNGEGYVLAASGPRNDAAERIRVFAEECEFDPEKFATRGFGEVDAFTFGVFRRR